MGHAPPVARLAVAFAAGASWVLLGAPLELAPLPALLLLAAPIRSFGRPGDERLPWVVAALAGLAAAAAVGSSQAACVPAATGEAVVLRGRFLASPASGAAPFEADARCGPVTAVVGDAQVSAGQPVLLEGEWREGRGRPWFLAAEVRPDVGVDAGGGGADAEWRWRMVRWRDGLVRRLDRLYGDRAPLIAALTLARREGLAPELREAFARVGIAHLLAISGFHVGVIAGVILAFLRVAGLSARRAALGAAGAAWIYVGFIGFPDAAARAAWILTAAALSRARGRPPAKWGAIGAALLILLALDPGRLVSPGFQLSFAGAAGLTAWSAPISGAIQRLSRRRCPRAVATALAAGLSATLATLPIVAWHFERVSLVGIPVTLLATPIVTLALIGALGSLVADFAFHGMAAVLAGGTGAIVALLESLTAAAAALPWASAWTTRGTVVGASAGVAVASLLARRPHVGASARRTMAAFYVGAGVLGWPLLLTLQGRGSAEVVMLDVGQGDAIALRSPSGRWVLVDAGPASDDGDPAAHPVVRALRSRGVRRLEALVLTHPDLDHIGGAASVLRSFNVGVVYDPGLAAGKEAFVDVLAVAAERGVPWRAARAGDLIELDGLSLQVLYPEDDIPAGAESNASSVVLHAALGEFDALLTGDAYKDVDRLLAPGFGDPVEVLKVGHHGSDTSTDPLLLDAIRPEVALVSVGRFNRYGHPAPEVLARLEEIGARVHRTDREGSIVVLGRPDGSYSVTSRR